MPNSPRMPSLLVSVRMLAVMAAVFALVAVLLAPSTPAAAAGSSIVASSDTAQVGESLVVDFATDAPDDTNWVAIYREGDGAPGDRAAALSWEYATGSNGSITLELSADRFLPGGYLIHFLARDGYDAITAPVPLSVSAESASINAPVAEHTAAEDRVGEPHEVADNDVPFASELTLSASSIHPGEEVSIEYAVADPKPLNWVGVYAAGATPGVDDARVYRYVADAGGTLRWNGTATAGWIGQGTTPPGEYEVFLFEDDGYTVLAGPESLTIESAPVEEPRPQTGGTADLRVLTWNIYQGGRSTGDDDLVNQQHVAEYIASLEPDVFASIETYGASETILAALNANDDGHVYTGTRITHRSNDNLWIFSRLPIVEVIPATAGLSVDDFNLGAVRVRLENNREVTVYDVWSTYTDPWIGDLIEENAQDVQVGEPARHSEDEIIAADRIQTASIADFLSFAAEHSPGADDIAIIGGDLNTISSEDWGAQWADCPSHYGLSYDLVATRQFAQAGYADTYRADNPDACAAPGVTWSPRLTMDTPDRIDLSYLRGSGASVSDAVILDERLPEHGAGEFYSDHAALLVDYRVASVGGNAPGQGPSPEQDGTTPPGELAATGAAAPIAALLAGATALIAGALLMTRWRRGAKGAVRTGVER